MKYSWLKTVFPIAAIFSFRMLGLFMLIPVFTLFSAQLENATPSLIGIALGSYGLSQGLLQIPFGMLSDRFGRKPILTLGLILFVLGSLLGAFSHSIYMMIFARILQGTGAIGSVLIALLADLTPDKERTKAMAVIGLSIGMSFSLAMVISPIICSYFGLSGIFYLTALLAGLGLVLLHGLIPTPEKEPFHLDTEVKPALLKSVIRNKHLQRLNAGIFFQHLILTSTFYALPLLLLEQIKAGHLNQAWHFYLPLMLVAFVTMIPFIILAEKKNHLKAVFLIAISFILFSQMSLVFINQHWLGFCIAIFIYFLGFNILEASLPSLISKQAEMNSKGTAMGIYSSCQFLGIFFGGLVAGIIFSSGSSSAIFIANTLISLVWFFISLFMKPTLYQSTIILDYHGKDAKKLGAILLTIPGVVELKFIQNKSIIYLRVDKSIYIEGKAEALIKSFSGQNI